ncbi:MAG TPA: MarR family winged helix-turn-helix transcriptional regulator [Acidimicrobiales bacterium]|nr:MarR family winged helix-turn-helix transcriptional regulator [Acidimicrobiales bacterium]
MTISPTAGMLADPSREQGSATTPWLLRRVNQRYRQAIRAELAAAGLSDVPQPGYWALTALAGGARDATELVGAMGVTKQAVSKLVENLVANGFVSRELDPADRRRSALRLTSKGVAALDCIDAAVDATERSFVGEVGAGTFAQLGGTLARLASLPPSPRGESV